MSDNEQAPVVCEEIEEDDCRLVSVLYRDGNKD
jgi:hypothetical protein